MSDAVHNLVIVGAGQGGLSVSYFLRKAGIDHVIFDRGEIGHSWSANRWDSFCLVTPNWTVNLPGKPYTGDDPDGFMLRDDFVQYMKKWAEWFGAPIVSGMNVRRITRSADHFVLETSKGPMRSHNVVVATATYQHPKIPEVSSQLPDHIRQLHAENYKNCRQAADGAVMVVGSGQTGCQIVEDFIREGQTIYLCVARTGRLPRRYRGRDCLSWQDDMGLLDRIPDMLDSPGHRFLGDPHVTGRDGGRTVSLYDFHNRGAKLLGRLERVDGPVATFRNDLADNLTYADEFAAGFMEKVDAYVSETGLSAPEPTEAELWGGPELVTDEIESPSSLDLDVAQINTVIWATGFAFDFGWIEGLETDKYGYPVTDCGKTAMPGLYFSGLNWMTKRKSGILYGVEEDARVVADHIIGRSAIEAHDCQKARKVEYVHWR